MVYGWKNVQARHFNFQVHIQLILIHFIDCALHRARWRRFFKNEGQCLQLIRASCKQIYQNVCVLQSTCYNYTCILFPQGKADWLNNHVQRWLRRNHRHQIRLVIHFMHGPTIVLAIVRARPFTRNGFTMHGFMNVFLFMRGSLVHLVRQPVSSTRELQAQPTLSEGMLSHASCHMHESSPHLATLWVQVLGNYACMHGIPLGVYHAKFTHEVML